jgi:DNA-binding MarR family transcriptional regulator
MERTWRRGPTTVKYLLAVMTYANDMSKSPTSGPSSASSAAAATPSQCRPTALAAELRVSLIHAVRRIRLERSSEHITDGQYSVLAGLVNNGPMTPGEIAEREQVKPPSMTRTVNVLADAGLVTRAAHPSDGRQVMVSVTEAGIAEVRETRRRRDAWLSHRLAELTTEDRATLARASDILREVASK